MEIKLFGFIGNDIEAINMFAYIYSVGLKNTNFVNPTGLDEDNHYSSAYDMALIAKELMKHEDIFKYTSIYEDYLRRGTKNEYWLVNTNKVVFKFYNNYWFM